MPTRRHLMTGAAALVGLAGAGLRAAGAAGRPLPDLEARPASAPLLPAGAPEVAVWGYDGTVPGPVLRVRQGDRLRLRLRNRLPQPTTIHWHGIRIDNRMDGVAGLTQPAVAPGDSFDYDFVVPDAGTFWYHPHHRSWEQLARGLYGVLVVEEASPPAVDRDLLLVVDDWRLGDDGALHTASFGNLHDWSHAGRLGNVLTVNGLDVYEPRVRAGERIRLRLCNTANARVLRLVLRDHAPVLVALDGMPLAVPRPAADGVTLAPGQRADLIVDMTADPGTTADIVAVDDRSRQELAVAGRLVYDARPAPRPAAELPAIAALPANPLPALPAADVDTDAETLELRIEGGAMGRLRSARYRGEDLELRDLVDHGMMWALNGVVGRTEQPLISVPRGRTVRITLVNDTRWPHGMHVHGHHVREIHPDGAGDWRDTVLVPPLARQDIAFVADNPGRWMLHCHMLEHQAGGMATWFEVT